MRGSWVRTSIAGWLGGEGNGRIFACWPSTDARKGLAQCAPPAWTRSSLASHRTLLCSGYRLPAHAHLSSVARPPPPALARLISATRSSPPICSHLPVVAHPHPPPGHHAPTIHHPTIIRPRPHRAVAIHSVPSSHTHGSSLGSRPRAFLHPLGASVPGRIF